MMIRHSLPYEKQAFRRKLTLVLVAFTIVAGGPLSLRAADAPDPNASAVPLASDAPGLVNSTSVPGLRPVPPPDSPADSASSEPPASQPVLPAPPTPTASSTPTATSSSAQGTPSQNVTVNLINLMVKRNLISQDDANNLIKQAEDEAATARAQAAAAQTPPPPADDTVRVTYVPDVVKQQIRDEVKDDVMKQARDEHWAEPNAMPDWVTRYHVTADLRTRYEGDFFPSGNDTTGDFHNFNAINTGAPFDDGINSTGANPPTYNVNQDRERFRLRARFGAWVDVGQGFSAGLRMGTGQDDNPVTENQTIGLANNAQGGNFSKYAVWLDRAFLRYEVGDSRDHDLTVTVGRFDNPFFSSSMIWANDIGFDGMAVQGRYKVTDGITPFFAAGGFPVFNTDYNFATTSSAKFTSEDKYLFAVQGGTDWNIAKDVTLKTGAALYYFENIEGKVSDPFTPLTSSDSGDTDDSRPSFAQNGNTYVALRNITPDASNDFGKINQWQYYGLATPFHEVALTAQLDFSQFDPFHISLLGEFVKNLAFDRSAIENNGSPQTPGPVNNTTTAGDPSSFNGGDTGYNVRLQLGQPFLEKLWDWNVNLTYRYVESDATVDAFTDADFGGPLTGTNLKGYIIGANLGLTSRVWTGIQWMSADAIAGPTYKNDLIQVDINAKF